MTDQPAAAANAIEARAQLAGRLADNVWGEKLTKGDPTTQREFDDLTTMASRTDDSAIALAMSGSIIGQGPNSDVRVMAGLAGMLREIGIPEPAIAQALKGDGVSEQEYRLAEAWKTRHMKDLGFVEKYLNGDTEAREKMTMVNIIISGGIKGKI
jgi:uncharacterized membrane protein